MPRPILLVLPVLIGLSWAQADVPSHFLRVERRANTFTVSEQGEAVLAIDHTGNITIVWTSRRQDDGAAGIYAQRFSPVGVPLGPETRLNATQEGAQTRPAAAYDNQGRLWCVWESYGQDGDAGGIILRGFNPDLTPSTAEMIVNEVKRGHQGDPAIDVDSIGRAIVAWSGPIAGGRGRRVFVRRYDQEHGLEQALVSLPPEHAAGLLPALAADDEGGFWLAWARNGPADGLQGIAACHFTRNGVADVPMVGVTHERGIEPAIAALSDGSLVIAWHQMLLTARPDACDYAIFTSRIDRRGRIVAPPRALENMPPGGTSGVAVTSDSHGGYIVAWNSRDAASGCDDLYARTFTIDGQPSGREFCVTAQREQDQRLTAASGARRIAVTPAGRIAAAWTGFADSGDKLSANLTLLSQPSNAERMAALVGDAVCWWRGAVRTVSQQIDNWLAGDDGACTLAVATSTFDAPVPHEKPLTIPPGEGDDIEPLGGAPGGGFQGFTPQLLVPPDPELAAGPNHLVAIINGGLKFFQKDGTEDFFASMIGQNEDNFFADVGANGLIFDPEALYDPYTDRFMIMAAEQDDSPLRGYFLLGISDDSDPNGTWYKYRLDVTSLAGPNIDSGNLGVDSQAIYLTADFVGADPKYLVYVLEKAPLLDGGPLGLTNDLVIADTQSHGLPVVHDADAPATYLIEHFEESTNTEVRLHALTDPLGALQHDTFMLTVPAYGRPEDPPQKDTVSRPNTFDARFWSCTVHDDRMWAAHHINANRVLARWYRIKLNGWPASGLEPDLTGNGNIDPGSGIRTFFPAIEVDACANAVMVFSRSSPNEYISMSRAIRQTNDGQFRPAEFVQVSDGPSPSGRWGDYGGIGRDPADPTLFWMHHEYTLGGPSNWRTWIASVVGRPLGDVNGDEAFDLDDVAGFVDVLIDPDNQPNGEVCIADMNRDGSTDGEDIGPFIEAIFQLP